MMRHSIITLAVLAALCRPAAASASEYGTYAATVLRIEEGDTFLAQVQVWPGIQIQARIHMWPLVSLHVLGACPEDEEPARRAREHLTSLIPPGSAVTLSKVWVGSEPIHAAVRYRGLDISRAMTRAGHHRPVEQKICPDATVNTPAAPALAPR